MTHTLQRCGQGRRGVSVIKNSKQSGLVALQVTNLELVEAIPTSSLWCQGSWYHGPSSGLLHRVHSSKDSVSAASHLRPNLFFRFSALLLHFWTTLEPPTSSRSCSTTTSKVKSGTPVRPRPWRDWSLHSSANRKPSWPTLTSNSCLLQSGKGHAFPLSYA